MGIFQAFSKLDLYLSSLHWLFLSLAAFADLLWFFVYKEVIIYWYLHGVINLSEMSGTTSGTMHSKHIITAFRTKAKFTNLQSSLTSLEPHDLMYTCKSQTCHLHTSIVSPYASPSAWNTILFFNGLANLKGQLLWEVLLGLIPRTPKDPVPLFTALTVTNHVSPLILNISRTQVFVLILSPLNTGGIKYLLSFPFINKTRGWTTVVVFKN